MKILTHTFVALSFLTASSCMVKNDIQRDDTQVLTLVANQLCSQSKQGYYVLSGSSAVVSPTLTPNAFDASARRSLLTRNAQSTSLPFASVCANLKRVNAAEIDHYLERPKNDRPIGYDRWSAFYDRFADAQGVMRLSLPGYSVQGDLAIVEVSAACGETCGSGFFWILRKAAGHWKLDLQSSIQGWTS
jgi:hypothetical protein